MKVMKTGFELLDDAFLNKGTAFTESERKNLDWTDCFRLV